MSLASIKTTTRQRHKAVKALAAEVVEWALDLLVAAKRVRPDTARAIRGSHLYRNIRVYFPGVTHGKVIEVPAGPFDILAPGEPAVRFAMAGGHTRYDHAKLRDAARLKYDERDREYQSPFHVPVFIYNRDPRTQGDARSFFSTIVHELFHAIDFMEYVAATYNVESEYNMTDASVDRLHKAQSRLIPWHLEYRAERATREALLPVTREEIERRVGPLWAALHPHAA